MRKKKYFGKRALLNLPGHNSTCAIVAEIEDSSTWKNGFNSYGVQITSDWDCNNSPTLNIADCTRSIALDLEISGEDSYKNSLYKVDTLIEALSGLRMGMVTERQRYLDRVSECKQVKEEE